MISMKSRSNLLPIIRLFQLSTQRSIIKQAVVHITAMNTFILPQRQRLFIELPLRNCPQEGFTLGIS
jgi:hypothetical protein